MRVRVHKARHYDPLSGINHFTVISEQLLDFPAPAGRLNAVVANKQCAVLDDCEVAQLAAGARPARARKRD